VPHLLGFLAVAAIITVTPGPDMALVTRSALRGGRRAALLSAVGVGTGLLVWTGAAVAGIAALLRTSALAFDVVRLAGAAYLVLLGLRALLSLRRRDPAHEDAAPPARRRRLPEGGPYLQGLLCNLLNPKIAVLFTSLIPQFVVPGPSATAETLMLGGLFCAGGMLWICFYALVAGSAAELLRRPRIRRAIDAVTGTALVGFGLRLAADAR
jgi:threonine/homoserine/homoserine lactone efflux protein